jgi:hypothetical protein
MSHALAVKFVKMTSRLKTVLLCFILAGYFVFPESKTKSLSSYNLQVRKSQIFVFATALYMCKNQCLMINAIVLQTFLVY